MKCYNLSVDMIPLKVLPAIKKEILYALKSEASRAIDASNFELAHNLTYCLKKLEETSQQLEERINKDKAKEAEELLRLAADIALMDDKNFGVKS